MAEEVSATDDAVPQTKREALDALFASVNRSDAPGLVVGVAQHGRTLYRRGFGLASVELGVANTPRTRMRIGSTSKHVTSLAALLLAEDGKLDIDAGVRTYLPELPSTTSEPTLRQFMSHTSGYRCYLDIGFLADGYAIRPKGAALAAQIRQRGMNFPPGERMIYCNGGYHLLSLVIERVAGIAFEEFLRERIFEPIGMIDTESVPSDFEIRQGMAVLHIPLPGGGFRRGIFPSEEIRGEGAIVSTIDDMLRWIAHLRGPKKVGSESTWAQITASTKLNNGSVNPYGLGLMRHPYRGVEVIHHAGGVTGGSCQMLTVPAHALDIIIITNGATLSPIETANRIVDTMLDAKDLGEPRPLPSAERFKPMIGTRYFAPASGMLAGFAEADGKLTVSVFNSQGLPLNESDDVVQLSFEDVAIGPIVVRIADLATEGAPPEKLTVSEAGNADEFHLLPALTVDAKQLGEPLVGSYRADDLDAHAVVAFEDDVLQLQVFGTFGINRLVLEPFSPNAFGWKVLDVLLPLTGALSIKRAGEQIEGFDLDTPRSRHVHFRRVPS